MAPKIASSASARMLDLSRPPLCSSPFPRRTTDPTPSDRATSASEVMLTTAARSFASEPSGKSGKSLYARSVTTRPRTESPRNSRRSLVMPNPFSNAYDRWVSAASRSSASANSTPSARSRTPRDDGPRTSATRLLDLDSLTPRVVPAVPADPVRKLGLMAVRTLRVGRCLALPVRGSFCASRLALLLLGYGHIHLPCSSVVILGQERVQLLPAGIGRFVPRAFPQVQVAAADRAQTKTVRPAE